MHPKFFGEPALFGVYHPPTGTLAGTPMAILVCPPIGHEHTRAHRAVRVLSRSLARAGHHVLRFDYRGMGDSAGDPADGGVEAWCDDIARALAELAILSGCRTIGMVGLRFGAALAVRALETGCAGNLNVQRLVLWDPILCGDEFFRVAGTIDSQFLNDPGRFPRLPRSKRRASRQESGEHLLGYNYPPGLHRSLLALDLRSLVPWPDVSTAVMVSQPSQECASLVTRLRAQGATTHYQLVDDAEANWEDYAHHERTLRAGRLITSIVAHLSAGVS